MKSYDELSCSHPRNGTSYCSACNATIAPHTGGIVDGLALCETCYQTINAIEVPCDKCGESLMVPSYVEVSSLICPNCMTKGFGSAYIIAGIKAILQTVQETKCFLDRAWVCAECHTIMAGYAVHNEFGSKWICDSCNDRIDRTRTGNCSI